MVFQAGNLILEQLVFFLKTKDTFNLLLEQFQEENDGGIFAVRFWNAFFDLVQFVLHACMIQACETERRNFLPGRLFFTTSY